MSKHRKSRTKRVPKFIPLFGKGNKLNSSLVVDTLTNEDRFYVKDEYEIVHRVDLKTYRLFKEE